MKKYYILSILSMACLTFNVQAEEENSCFADNYAERVRTEMEESSYESSDEFEDLETASRYFAEEEMETEAECSSTNEDPTAFAEDDDDFDIPHLSFHDFEEEEDLADTTYEWEHETSATDMNSSLWDDLEDDTASNDELTEGTFEPTEGEA
jgi:hypothetical protein